MLSTYYARNKRVSVVGERTERGVLRLSTRACSGPAALRVQGAVDGQVVIVGAESCRLDQVHLAAST